MWVNQSLQMETSNHFNRETSYQFESSWWQNMTLSRTAFETPNKATIYNNSNQ